MDERSSSPERLAGVGATSLGVAFLRAQESARADRLIEDPYATCVLEAAAGSGFAWMASAPAPSGERTFFGLMADQVAVRTRFLDQTLLDAAAGGCGQVVLLACGMDTRAFRLTWPTDTQVFEVDFGDVLAFRDAALAAHDVSSRCRRTGVPADLREDWPAALREAGFDSTAPTAWLLEGLLYALPAQGADQLLKVVSGLSAPGSMLALDHVEDSAVLRSARRAIAPEWVELWQGGPTENLASWLARFGWDPCVHDLGDIAEDYRRAVSAELTDGGTDGGHAWLATASR